MLLFAEYKILKEILGDGDVQRLKTPCRAKILSVEVLMISNTRKILPSMQLLAPFHRLIREC